jgi:CAAX protease family protein
MAKSTALPPLRSLVVLTTRAHMDPRTGTLESRAEAAALFRGFGPLGLFAILAVLLTGNIYIAPLVPIPVGAALVLLWARLTGTPWRELGFVRPTNWPKTIVVAALLGAAFKVVMKTLVMPIVGAPPVNPTYHFLVGNRALVPAAIWAMLNAGFSEETIFRGFLFERLGKLLGSGTLAKGVIVASTSALFAFAHYADQRLPGVEQAAITGLVFGSVFATTGRVIPVMIAHAAFDLTALAMIYWNAEASFARAVFR